MALDKGLDRPRTRLGFGAAAGLAFTISGKLNVRETTTPTIQRHKTLMFGILFSFIFLLTKNAVDLSNRFFSDKGATKSICLFGASFRRVLPLTCKVEVFKTVIVPVIDNIFMKKKFKINYEDGGMSL